MKLGTQLLMHIVVGQASGKQRVSALLRRIGRETGRKTGKLKADMVPFGEFIPRSFDVHIRPWWHTCLNKGNYFLSPLMILEKTRWVEILFFRLKDGFWKRIAPCAFSI